jgi:hypothetical protein
VLARFDDDLAVRTEQPLAAPDGVLHELGGQKIAVNRRDAIQADRRQVAGELLRGVR